MLTSVKLRLKQAFSPTLVPKGEGTFPAGVNGQCFCHTFEVIMLKTVCPNGLKIGIGKHTLGREHRMLVPVVAKGSEHLKQSLQVLFRSQRVVAQVGTGIYTQTTLNQSIVTGPVGHANTAPVVAFQHQKTTTQFLTAHIDPMPAQALFPIIHHAKILLMPPIRRSS